MVLKFAQSSFINAGLRGPGIFVRCVKRSSRKTWRPMGKLLHHFLHCRDTALINISLSVPSEDSSESALSLPQLKLSQL